MFWVSSCPVPRESHSCVHIKRACGPGPRDDYSQATRTKRKLRKAKSPHSHARGYPPVTENMIYHHCRDASERSTKPERPRRMCITSGPVDFLLRLVRMLSGVPGPFGFLPARASFRRGELNDGRHHERAKAILIHRGHLVHHCRVVRL